MAMPWAASSGPGLRSSRCLAKAAAKATSCSMSGSYNGASPRTISAFASTVSLETPIFDAALSSATRQS